MSSPSHPAVQRIERSLRRLERRRRLVSLASAVAVWLLCIVPAAGLLCLLDWYSDMPLVVRWLATAGFLAGAAFLFRRFVAPAARQRLVVDQSALSVERTFPQLADRVISAVQLDRRQGDPGYGSEELKQAAQQQAVEWAQRVTFSKAAPLFPAGLFILLAIGVASLAGWLAVANSDIVSIWAVRCVWNKDYPRKTKIVRVQVNDRDTMRVARGDAAVITVHAAGPILPERGQVQIQTADAGRVTLDLLRSAAPGQRNMYTARIEQVVERLPFRIQLGDAATVSGLIDVVDPPEVSDIYLDLAYPAYTGRPVERVRSGHVRAVEGTRVSLTVRASKPLKWARVNFDSGGSQTMSATQPEKSASADASWATEFTVGDPQERGVSNRSGGYVVTLQDRDDEFRNSAPVHYLITPVPDGPPKVQLVRPAAEALATPASLVRIEYRLTDDFGLRRGRLMFYVQPKGALQEGAATTQPGAGKTYRAIPLPLPGLTSTQPDAGLPAPGPRQTQQVLAWDLTSLGLNVNDVVFYHVEADDHAPRKTDTPGVCPDRQIRIVEEAVLRKQLQDQLESTAQQIERIYTLERDSQDQIKKLRNEIHNGATSRPAGSP